MLDLCDDNIITNIVDNLLVRLTELYLLTTKHTEVEKRIVIRKSNIDYVNPLFRNIIPLLLVSKATNRKITSYLQIYLATKLLGQFNSKTLRLNTIHNVYWTALSNRLPLCIQPAPLAYRTLKPNESNCGIINFRSYDIMFENILNIIYSHFLSSSCAKSHAKLFVVLFQDASTVIRFLDYTKEAKINAFTRLRPSQSRREDNGYPSVDVCFISEVMSEARIFETPIHTLITDIQFVSTASARKKWHIVGDIELYVKHTVMFTFTPSDQRNLFNSDEQRTDAIIETKYFVRYTGQPKLHRRPYWLALFMVDSFLCLDYNSVSKSRVRKSSELDPSQSLSKRIKN